MSITRRFTASLLGVFIGIASFLLLAPQAAGDSDWPPAPAPQDTGIVQFPGTAAVH